jgi:hypothetical protein
MLVEKNNIIQKKTIANIVKLRGYKKMSLKQLQQTVLNINPTLASHDSLKSKRQILNFLYSWEWANYYCNEIC